MNITSHFFPVLIAGFFLCQGNLQADSNSVPELRTSGTALLKVDADQASISFSVVTEHENSTTAIRENSQKVTEVLNALKSAGLSKDEYKTGSFNVWPRHDHGRSNSGSERIIGYQVSNSLLVTTRRLDIVGKVIDAANVAGANKVDYISFGLADLRTQRKEAIEMATQNATQDAEYLAEAAGVSLKKIISIQVDDAHGGGGTYPFRSEGMLARASSGPDVPLEPGTVSIRARVEVSWQIE